MKKTVLICGAGGFIGSHLTSSLIKEKKFNIICADIKPFKQWFQFFDKTINFFRLKFLMMLINKI